MSEALFPFSASQCILALLLVFTLSKLIRAYKSHHELAHIPCIGPSGFFSSYVGAFRYLTNGHEMLAEGYEKYPGRVFRVPTLDKWIIVISGPKLVDDLRKASDSQLSILETAADILQLQYTLGNEVWMNPYHIDVIRTQVTRNIGSRFSDIRNEMLHVFSNLMPLHDGWTKALVYDTAQQVIARTSARFFVGYPLCREDDYIDMSIKITTDVFITGYILSGFPGFLRPVAGRLLPKVPKLIRQGMKYLGPLIQERLDMKEKYGSDWPGKPNDFISWLLDVEGQDRSIRDLTCRVLATNIAAIHTTSTALTWALYQLAAHPELVPSLREEVESVTEREGWTKVALVQMRKLDSFIKESSRIYSSGGGISRKVVQDFTFSDGTRVPKGYFVNVAVRSSYYDEKNYPRPDEFQGTRFSDMRQQDGESIKHQMITPELDHLLFGIGRHACPGRFFAVNEVKLAIAHILMTYDIKFENGTVPTPTWFISIIGVDSKAELLFRARKRTST